MLSDGDHVGAGDFGDGDTAIGGVGCVEVDVVRTDTCGNGKLELLGFGETLGGQVTGVEAVSKLASNTGWNAMRKSLRSSDDNLRVNELLVELGVLALLV